MSREGSQIGPYTLIEKLGQGGFGEVWLAERKSKFVTTKVAVKLPLAGQVNPEAISQEATLWQQASGHANVLPIIDADEYDGQIVIVSEYAPDGSLEQRLKQNGRMPLEKAVETTIQVLNGLEYLHSRQIIHRDLKPANILLQGDTPLLADFGISRILGVSTTSSVIVGTEAYMAPEAFEGKRSVQTDIWSVGIILYRLLTGNLPFSGGNAVESMYAVCLKEFEPLPDYVPSDLKSIVAKALAKSPENRYVTAREMSADLRRLLFGDYKFSSSQIEQTNSVQRPTSSQLETPTVETVVRTKEANSENKRWWSRIFGDWSSQKQDSTASMNEQSERQSTNKAAFQQIEKKATPSLEKALDSTKGLNELAESFEKHDPLFLDALRSVVIARRASTSLLQRHLRIGYSRAADILDAMVREGYIGEMDGSTRAHPILQKAYEVLQSVEESRDL